MAPFVEVEWGRQATAIMQRIKDAFDPHHLLNPGVILTQVQPCTLWYFQR
jgi:D-lactate dehydrogenase